MNQKLVIAVCTAQRPKMLQACLDSLDKLIQPDGTELAIVVVENDPVPHFAGQAAEDMKTRLSLPVFFSTMRSARAYPLPATRRWRRRLSTARTGSR
ncbi:hypothetical protein QW131_25450 [Roseibium salinum]|nr:hypothetical protein [Roseibium salinum]